MSGNERPLPWAVNWRAQRVLSRLQRGPASTIDLQEDLPMVHVARQIWELRHWYGWKIVTGRLPNGVAVYRLYGQEALTPLEQVGGPAPVAPPAVPKPTNPVCPACGAELGRTEPSLSTMYVKGRCPTHGWVLARS